MYWKWWRSKQISLNLLWLEKNIMVGNLLTSYPKLSPKKQKQNPPKLIPFRFLYSQMWFLPKPERREPIKTETFYFYFHFQFEGQEVGYCSLYQQHNVSSIEFISSNLQFPPRFWLVMVFFNFPVLSFCCCSSSAMEFSFLLSGWFLFTDLWEILQPLNLLVVLTRLRENLSVSF